MKSKIFYGYIIVLSGFLIMMIMAGTLYTFGVFFEPLLTEFGWSRAAISGAYSLYMMMHGLFYIVTGRLNDRFGPRIIVTACGLCFGLGYLLISQISAIWQLYLFYGVLVAAGMSGGFIPLGSTVARWFVKRRGLMTGIVMSGVGLGTMIMPPVANWLIYSYSWRTAYIVVGSIALVLVVLAAQFLRRAPSLMAQLPYGAGEAKKEGLNLEAGGFSFSEAVCTRRFWMLCVVVLCFGFCLQVILVHIVPHAIDKGISAATAASILTVVGGLGIAGRVMIGGSADRIGNKLAFIIGFILMVIALSLVVVARDMWMFYLSAAIFGCSYGGLVAVQSPMVANLFGMRSHGTILGVIAFNATLGGAIGPLLAGYIFDITSSYHLIFLICVVLGVSGLIILTLTPISGKSPRN